MDQAHAEVRAAEAAAEQRIAAALALERAELDKQVQLMLICGSATALHCSGLLLQDVYAPDDGQDGCTRHADVTAWGEGKLVFLPCVMPC